MKFAHIETTAYSESEILFFIRLKGKQHFFEKIYGVRAMERLFGHVRNHHTISEYKNADHYIDVNRFNMADLTPNDYDIYYSCVHDNLESIITRCRGLRVVPFYEAKLLIFAALKYFVEFLGEKKYKLIVIHIVDNYVLDVMYRVAQHFGVEVLVLSEWMVENYRRHTIYGELIPFREPPESEVLDIERHLLRNEKNFWLKGMGRFNRKRYALYIAVRYWLLYLARYVYRYKVLGDNAYEYRFANVIKATPKYLFVSRFFDDIEEDFVRNNSEKLIVVPLHTFPEANVDYWMRDSRHADYYTTLFEAFSFFREEGITLLVKEHPGFLYQRDPSLYRLFKRFDNVRLIDPMSQSALLLDQVPTVLVWHGSMGIEALVRGKKVVAFESNYYSDGFVVSYRDYKQARPFDDVRRREFVRYLLRGVQQI